MTTLQPPSEAVDITADGEVPMDFLQEVGLDAESSTFTGVQQADPRRSAFLELLSVDLVAAVLALLSSAYIDMWVTPKPVLRPWTAAGYAPVILAVCGFYALYRRPRRRVLNTGFPDLGYVLHAAVTSAVVVFFLSGLTRHIGMAEIDRTGAAVLGGLLLLGILGGRGVLYAMPGPLRSHASRVAIVGSGEVADSIARRLTDSVGVSVVGYVNDGISHNLSTVGDLPRLGSLYEFDDILKDKKIDHVVVAFGAMSSDHLAAFLRPYAGKVQISVVPRLFDLVSARSRVDDLHGMPVVDVAPPALGRADRFAKRATDLLAASLGLLFLTPIWLTVAILVKLTSPGPILFSQSRVGRGGKTFKIHKFRSMYVDAEERKAELQSDSEGIFKIFGTDPRVTPIGAILRKTSLDEIPQLLNVVKGDMSLVGPRPFIESESAGMSGWAAKRFDVRPGMTGLWQVSGRNNLRFDDLCRLDYAYVASWSIWWDLKILWNTPSAVTRRRGAY